jgi:putative endonuclease
MLEHKRGVVPGFTKKYKINRLVYYETTPSPLAAIEREKTLKGWLRKRKIALICTFNPLWIDLSQEWDAP